MLSTTRCLALLVAVLTWGASSPAAFCAKSYHIESVVIAAQVQPDGSMTINETRTYRFVGRFSYAFYTQLLEGTGGYTDIRVSEGDRAYVESPSRDPGTYQVTRSEGRIEIRWNFRARNETRTFDISYRVLDVVRVYRDIAELHFNFVGNGWDRPTRSVRIGIAPPPGASRGDVRAWAHGPLWGSLAIENSGAVRLTIDNLPRRTAFAARVLYPPALFTNAAPHLDEAHLAAIMAEESRLAAAANARREAARRKLERREALRPYLTAGVILLAAVSWLLWWFFYKRYGRERTHYPSRYSSDLPQMPPALVSYLFNSKHLGAAALVSTLLDLAQRGFLTIKQDRIEKRSLFGTRTKDRFEVHLNRVAMSSRAGELSDFEENLISFLFDELAHSDTISFDEIRSSRREVTEWFKDWKKLVEHGWEGKPYYDRSSVRGALISALLQLPLIAAGVFIAIEFGALAVIAIASSVMAAVLSVFIARRTPEVEAHIVQWKALKRYLSRYHKQQIGTLSPEQVGSYLVYAVALGVSGKALEALADVLPAEQAAVFLPWYAAYHSAGQAGLGAAVASLTTVAASTMSSAAGVGGGASGAAGGAAGGSGGGAG